MGVGDRRVGIGLIGAGGIGRLHAQHLTSRVPGARLVAVADVDGKAAASCAEEHQVPSVYEDVRDLLADRAVDAVVICSPPDTHARIIEEAAARGKHVFCEKPIDCDLGKIDRALAAVARAGVKLQVGFNRRFDENFRYVREAVASGRVGEPRMLHIVSRDPRLPAPSQTQATVGLFLDMTIHDFDMARYLLASEVAEVYALAQSTAGRADPDTALITMRFASGAMGTIDNGQTVYGYDQRVEVFGSEGSVRVDNEQPHRASVVDRSGTHGALPLHFFVERYAPSYIAELIAFTDCILRDTEPPVTGHDGRMAAVLALAAQRSLEEKRPVAPKELSDD